MANEDDELDLKELLIGQESALGRGIGQGVTAGFRDELEGSILGAGKTIYDFARDYLGGGGHPSNLVENYKKYRDESRAQDKTAQESSPGVYGAANVAGSLALPGSGVRGLAAQGAATGAGASESKNLSGDVINAIEGSAIGAGIGKTAEVGSRLFNQFLKSRGSKAAQQVSEAPVKPELELRSEAPIPLQNQTAKDRIAQFRKRQAAGETYKNKSDDLAKELYNLDPLEGQLYNPKVDDITVPKDQRQLFGVGESDRPITSRSPEFDRLLMGEAPFPKQSKVPSNLQYDKAGNAVDIKSVPPPAFDGTATQSGPISQILQTNPEMLGPYAKPLMAAAQRGSVALATTQYVLAQRDPQFRSLLNQLANPINVE